MSKIGIPRLPREFVGRGMELRESFRALRKGRLLAVWGEPGIGRSAFLAALARQGLDLGRWDVVHFASLRGLPSAEAIAAILPLEGPAPRTLLVLDHFEDPWNLDRDAVRAWISRLLQSWPRLRVALALRQPPELGPDMHALRLGPLGAEESSRILGQGLDAGLSQILRGNPLALRLARGLLGGAPAGELEQRLREEGEGLGGVIRAAIRSLCGRHAEAGRLLSLFRWLPGGALAEDLDWIAGEAWREPMRHARAAGLARLEAGVYRVPASVLVHLDELEPDSTAKAWLSRLGQHFSAMIRVLENSVAERSAPAWALFQIEELNLWACLDPAWPGGGSSPREPLSRAAAVALGLPRLLLAQNRRRDAARALELAGRILEREPDAAPQLEALHSLGQLRLELGEFEAARAAYQRLVELYQELDEPRHEANAWRVLGDIDVRRDDEKEALRCYEMGMVLHREIANPKGEANCREGIGRIRLAEENFEAARAEFEQALHLYGSVSATQGVAASLGYLGRVEMMAGRADAAVDFFEQALGKHRELRDRAGEGLDLRAQAEAFWQMGSRPGALAAWWLARAIFLELGWLQPAAGITETFSMIREPLQPEEWKELESDLEAHAETRRKAFVDALLRKA